MAKKKKSLKQILKKSRPRKERLGNRV